MQMNLLWLLVIILLIGALVGWPGVGPVQHQYGYYPSGLGIILIVVLLILLLR